MSYINLIIRRSISTTSVREGKRNFKKFSLHNKRGSRIFKQQQQENPDPEVPVDKRGTRDVGYKLGSTFVTIPEMIPEIIVPSLKDFHLKPYVSYRSPEVVQTEFTAQDLFNVIYASKISKDFEENKLKEDGSSTEPSAEEKLDASKAYIKARQTGSDIF